MEVRVSLYNKPIGVFNTDVIIKKLSGVSDWSTPEYKEILRATLDTLEHFFKSNFNITIGNLSSKVKYEPIFRLGKVDDVLEINVVSFNIRMLGGSTYTCNNIKSFIYTALTVKLFLEVYKDNHITGLTGSDIVTPQIEEMINNEKKILKKSEIKVFVVSNDNDVKTFSKVTGNNLTDEELSFFKSYFLHHTGVSVEKTVKGVINILTVKRALNNLLKEIGEPHVVD